MQENNTNGGALAGNIIRRLDPRTKLALLLMSFVMVLLPQRPAVVALASAAVLAHLALARAWPALKPVRWLLVILAVFSLGVWSWMAQGPSHLFWRVSRESLAFGTANFLKLATMMVAGLILLATTPVEELFNGLVKLRLPYAGAFAFALALRWVPEIFATVGRVREAQEARGLSWEKGSILERLRRHLPLLAPIFLLTLRRSQTMAWALEARGFQMSPHRSFLLEIRMQPRDWLTLAASVVLVIPFIVLHVWGWDQIPGLKL
ncbi:MAG: energy-coupling factor transporter transmembrane protein EcfT [Deltaproteobacteria bacterium]|nr:energy-coupling factor transporter transmembrane protein EcfT [Deltaproteobacteria bacterium]